MNNGATYHEREDWRGIGLGQEQSGCGTKSSFLSILNVKHLLAICMEPVSKELGLSVELGKGSGLENYIWASQVCRRHMGQNEITSGENISRIYPGLGRAKEGRPLSGPEKKEKASKTDGKAAASDTGKLHGGLKKYRERKK